VALSGLRMGSVGQVGDSRAFCPDALSLALFETWDWPLPRGKLSEVNPDDPKG
jgi:hypothetical protein